MDKFKDVLLDLDEADEVLRIELYYEDGEPAGVIHNKPGSTGSVKVYNHLYKTFGSIDVDAAVEGLSLYAEHTADAEDHPGKHPNIDRLFNVIDDQEALTVKIIPAE
ncbi:MAG: DUF2322 family protein [Methylophilaceae bacterium]